MRNIKKFQNNDIVIIDRKYLAIVLRASLWDGTLSYTGIVLNKTQDYSVGDSIKFSGGTLVTNVVDLLHKGLKKSATS